MKYTHEKYRDLVDSLSEMALEKMNGEYEVTDEACYDSVFELDSWAKTVEGCWAIMRFTGNRGALSKQYTSNDFDFDWTQSIDSVIKTAAFEALGADIKDALAVLMKIEENKC